jgi:hypothetical protein
MLACAAAATLLFLHQRQKSPRVPTAQIASPIEASASLAESSGDVRIDGAPAVAQASLHASQVITTGAGRACVVVEPKVRACLDHDSEIRIADLTLATRNLELRRGRVVAELEPQPEHATFSVSTPVGSVTAIGTAFVVDARQGMVARVLHGVVAVRTERPETRLEAHDRIDLVTGDKAHSTPHEEEDDQALLDGTVAAPPPTPAIDIAPTASASTTTQPAPPPAELLRTARGLRGEHKLTEAAQTYRRLETTYPDSAEAHASYVSLGELQLKELADPAAALRSFDAYLRAPGPSTREAKYGRIRALHALGRTDEEKRAIESFVVDYPSSEEASELRERLK